MPKSYCDYPWQHLYVHTSGHNKICCMSEDNITKDDGYHHFNTKNDGLFDSWNSQYMKEIRQKMLAGEIVSNCQKCLRSESEGLESMRIEHNREQNLAITNTDGSIDTFPDNLELHFGNTCNLNCKMCSQMFSHSIGKELIKMGEQDPEFLKWVKKESGVLNNWTGELDMVYDWYKIDKVKKSIFENVSQHIKNLTVIGGEPTVIKEFYELLEYCHSRNTLKEKSLMITTNMTNTNKNLSTWLGACRRYTIHASIDGLDQRNAYIRYPANWSSILKSIDYYSLAMEKYKNGCFSFSPAIQLLNIDQIDDLCLFFFENFATSNCDIAWVSQVRYPIICDYAILPREYRSMVSEKLTASASKFKSEKIRHNIIAIANDLKKDTYTDQQKKTYQEMFVRYNDQQDRFRAKTTWRQLLPDLEKSLTASLK